MKSFLSFVHRFIAMLFLILFGLLGVTSFFVRSHLDSTVKWETVQLVSLFPPTELVATFLISGILIVLSGMADRLHKWTIMLVAFLWVVFGSIMLHFLSVENMVYDSLYVIDAASGFARGSYTALDLDYFQMYSYQLGFCLPLEFLYRILPKVPFIRTCQYINLILVVGSVFFVVKVLSVITDGENGNMVPVLCLLNPVFLLYCVFVYGTIPMVFFSCVAIFCFIFFLKTHSIRYAAGWVAAIGIAYAIKPNAALPMLAMFFTSGLVSMEKAWSKSLIIGIISIVVCLLCARGVITFYALRGNKVIGPGITTVSRLAMGTQTGGAAPGWFNDFSEDCWRMGTESGNAAAIEVLKTSFQEWLGNPLKRLTFMFQKIVSQWIEPTSASLWIGYISNAAFGQEVPAVYAQDSAARLFLEYVMLYMLRITYLFSATEMIYIMKRKKLTELVLPMLLLGGYVYHALFEAKSLYMFPYIFFITVIAARGISDIHGSIKKRRKKF